MISLPRLIYESYFAQNIGTINLHSLITSFPTYLHIIPYLSLKYGPNKIKKGKPLYSDQSVLDMPAVPVY
jgi:hypothetical protein